MPTWITRTFGALTVWKLWSFIPKITMQNISPKSAIEQFLCPINHSLVIEFVEECDLVNHSFRVVMLIATGLAIVSAIVAALMIPSQ